MNNSQALSELQNETLQLINSYQEDTVSRELQLSHSLVSLSEKVEDVSQALSALQNRILQLTNLSQLYEQLLENVEVIEKRAMNNSQALSTIYKSTEMLNELIQKLIPPSCAALPPSFPSGYYWVRVTNGSAVPVYCDMTRSCGGVTQGWMRVADLDMTDSSQQCPSGLR